MARVRKYLAGEPLTIGQAAEAVMRGEYVLFYAKPMHPGWVASMQLNSIAAYAKRGAIRAALPNPDFTEPKGTTA